MDIQSAEPQNCLPLFTLCNILQLVLLLLPAVVELVVADNMLTIPEGEMVFVCVNATNSLRERQTDIILTYSVTVGNRFTSKLIT